MGEKSWDSFMFTLCTIPFSIIQVSCYISHSGDVVILFLPGQQVPCTNYDYDRNAFLGKATAIGYTQVDS